MSEESVVYAVRGMHCAGCERSITQSLGQLRGITVVEVSHEEGFVRLESTGAAAPDEVISAIEKLGYTAARVSPES